MNQPDPENNPLIGPAISWGFPLLYDGMGSEFIPVALKVWNLHLSKAIVVASTLPTPQPFFVFHI